MASKNAKTNDGEINKKTLIVDSKKELEDMVKRTDNKIIGMVKPAGIEHKGSGEEKIITIVNDNIGNVVEFTKSMRTMLQGLAAQVDQVSECVIEDNDEKSGLLHILNLCDELSDTITGYLEMVANLERDFSMADNA